jgi:hypothetical protein
MLQKYQISGARRDFVLVLVKKLRILKEVGTLKGLLSWLERWF